MTTLNLFKPLRIGLTRAFNSDVVWRVYTIIGRKNRWRLAFIRYERIPERKSQPFSGALKLDSE